MGAYSCCKAAKALLAAVPSLDGNRLTEDKDFLGGEFYFPYTSENLDGRYPAFGKVLSGWEEVECIEKVPLRPVLTKQNLIINEPITPEVIESVTVETFGVEYPDPIRYEDRELPFNWFLDQE